MSVKVYDTITPASTTFPAVMAEHVNLVREDGTADSIQNLFNSKELGGGGGSSVTLTQQEYEALADEEKYNGLYYCYDVGKIYKNGVEYARSPIVTVVETEDGHNVDIEDISGVQSFEILNGKNAVQFTPSITENGELAWENDGDLENPPTTPIQTLISTAPLGTVLSFAGSTAPNGYLLCDGKSYAVADYEDLYAVIGNTYGGDTENFNVPDYRETVLVGVGQNTTDTIASHDVYELGEFKDDQMQSHSHTVSINNAVYAYTPTFTGGPGPNGMTTTSTSNNSGRSGTTTHGKQKGVTYIIKAFHTNEGVDSNDVTDQIIEYVEGEIAEVESKINPTIDISAVFSNGALNIATLCSTYGNGRYVIVGQGTTGNGSATIDIWTLASHAISYIVNVTYSNKTSNTFIGLTYENPTINFETNYLGACNHIAKVCTLV